MTENVAEQNGYRKMAEKKLEEINSYNDGKYNYDIGDTVYIESQRSDMPYYICSIRDFKKSKKDNITIDVVWYYRPCEIPTSVYQLLLQDRNAENGSSDHLLENPDVKNRELFISDAIDVYPASALRGHVNCVPFSEVKENVMQYITQEDNWFYILRYNPESRRMANAKGEIRIGASHQACLPAYKAYGDRTAEELMQLNAKCVDELVWEPSIQESKLMVFLRAACSITSFNGYCDTQDGSPEKALNVLSEDQTAAHSYDMLHQHNYNISEALQNLIRNPTPKITTVAWTEEERKKFVRGLRSYGKTFHKIRKELLPDRSTSELVHYYYIWKKTATAANSRPHKRGGRRNNVLRKTRTTKPKTAVASEFLDLSSCSENEIEECEDSENERDLSLYACRHCYTSKSRNWHHAGKTKLLLCHSCRMHFKRYGHMKSLKEEEKREPPPFIYKAAFENLDDPLQYSGRMRTRRSSTPVLAGTNNARNRLLDGGKISYKKQITMPGNRDNSDDSKEEQEVKVSTSKRRGSEENDGNKSQTKKPRVDMKDSDDAEDADDESDESETGSRSDSNDQITNQSSRSQSPTPLTAIEKSPCNKETDSAPPPPHTFLPIKQEELDTEDKEKLIESPPSSPDVPDNLALCKKIADRFIHNATQVGNSCSRCERIYIHKKRKKQRPTELETLKRREEQHMGRFPRELDHKHDGTPPLHQPAQITSHYETNRLLAVQAARNPEPQRFWPNYLPPDIHRAVSPREYLGEATGKFNHLLNVLDRPPEHHSPHTPLPHADHPSHAVHPVHPFTPRPNESSRDFRMSARSHISSHVPAAIEGLSRIPSGLEGITAERGPIDRLPPIDPVTGLPSQMQPHVHSHLQPHVHSHLHTHTHLHVHPDDVKYRAHGAPPESHHERHERTTPHQISTVSPHQPHRPNSRSRECHDQFLKPYPDLLVHHDSYGRDPRHIASNTRDTFLPPGREGAVSPHDLLNTDPVAYHLWVKQSQCGARMHQRWNSHSGAGQAPELSPHGIPPQHAHHIRNEHEKQMLQARTFEYEKHLRQMLQAREQTESLKVKSEHPEPSSSFRPAEIHSSYHNNVFMENIRRLHDSRRTHDSRSIHDRYGHNERAERERLAHLERVVHLERPCTYDRSRHDRASIFGHYRPDTIELSDD